MLLVVASMKVFVDVGHCISGCQLLCWQRLVVVSAEALDRDLGYHFNRGIGRCFNRDLEWRSQVEMFSMDAKAQLEIAWNSLSNPRQDIES